MKTRERMKKMARILLVLLTVAFVSLQMVACEDFFEQEEEEEHAPIDCSIRFVKEAINVTEPTNGSESSSDNRFSVDASVYVVVEFTLSNNSDEDDVVDFVVTVPAAECYSVIDCISGTVIPTLQREAVDENGIHIKTLSGMQFSVKKGKTLHYVYIFELKAKQECQNMSFKVKFEAQQGKLIPHSYSFGDSIVYSFFAAEETSAVEETSAMEETSAEGNE